MKSDNLLRHILIPFGIAIVIYIVFYSAIEHRRTRNGPWHVTFTNSAAGVPALLISETNLAIASLQISFPGETNRTNAALVFSQPQPVPFEVPYGKCVFMDTTFQPGTIVLDLFGHEIQLIPRVLTIDQKEIPWQPDKAIVIEGTNVTVSP